MLTRILVSALIVLTVAMIMLGATVHATGSSLACPDWPTCYGSLNPPMEGGVLYEHGHRLLGTLIGVGVLVLLALLTRAAALSPAAARTHWATFALVVVQSIFVGVGVSRTWAPPVLVGAVLSVPLVILLSRQLRNPATNLAAYGLLLLELVIMQGVLGGLTVVLKISWLVSSAHLGLSMVLLGMVTVLALRLMPGAEVTGAPLMPRRLLGVALAVLFLQIVLGAFLKHTGASYACANDLVLCAGGMPSHGAAHAHFTHRILAFVVMGLVIASAVRAGRAARQGQRPLTRRLAASLHGVVTLQVVLGFLTVATFVAPTFAVLHLGVGAVLFALLVALYVSAGPLGARRDAPLVDAPASGLVGAAG